MNTSIQRMTKDDFDALCDSDEIVGFPSVNVRVRCDLFDSQDVYLLLHHNTDSDSQYVVSEFDATNETFENLSVYESFEIALAALYAHTYSVASDDNADEPNVAHTVFKIARDLTA